jgi:hypothetical protein
MTVRTYSSPQAFKEAVEQRLRSASKNGVDFARRRQLLVFDRFLARVVAVLRDAVLLKGGLVLELRLDRARTTKDIDLRLIGSPETVRADLQKAGRQVLGDFMTFEVTRDTEQPKIQNDGMKYEGLRFRAECRLAGKLYGQVFGVDVAFGDPVLGEPETNRPVAQGTYLRNVSSPATKQRLRLDAQRSWIITTELNQFIWPGPDLRPTPSGEYLYGYLPRETDAPRTRPGEEARTRQTTQICSSDRVEGPTRGQVQNPTLHQMLQFHKGPLLRPIGEARNERWRRASNPPSNISGCALLNG